MFNCECGLQGGVQRGYVPLIAGLRMVRFIYLPTWGEGNLEIRNVDHTESRNTAWLKNVNMKNPPFTHICMHPLA